MFIFDTNIHPMNALIKPIDITSREWTFVCLTFADGSTKYCAIESYNEQTQLVKCLKVDKVITINRGLEEADLVRTDESNFEYFPISSIKDIQDIPHIRS